MLRKHIRDKHPCPEEDLNPRSYRILSGDGLSRSLGSYTKTHIANNCWRCLPCRWIRLWLPRSDLGRIYIWGNSLVFNSKVTIQHPRMESKDRYDRCATLSWQTPDPEHNQDFMKSETVCNPLKPCVCLLVDFLVSVITADGGSGKGL
jgi:hypothetical protein